MEIVPPVTMETLHNLYHDSEAMYQRTSLVIWGLSGFIMLFAVINLINTLIATTLSRKHEFSTLRSIGMGKKQLQWTIQWEGVLLAFLEYRYYIDCRNGGRLWHCPLLK